MMRESKIIIDQISICQKKIEQFISIHPEKENQIVFLKFKNTCVADSLYHKHIDELLLRIINKEPLENLTDAEVLSIMSKVNQFISLPGNEFTTAIKILFSKLFIYDDIVDDICSGLEERTGSKWDDEAKIIIDKIKSKFKIDFRK